MNENIFNAEIIGSLNFRVLIKAGKDKRKKNGIFNFKDLDLVDTSFFEGSYNVRNPSYDEGLFIFNVNKYGIYIYFEGENFIIGSKFYSEDMNKFEYQGALGTQEDLLFSIPSHILIKIVDNKNFNFKTDILNLSIPKRNGDFVFCIKEFKKNRLRSSYDIPIQILSNDPPRYWGFPLKSEYCKIPVDLKNITLWDKKISSEFSNFKPKKVIIRLYESTIQFKIPYYHNLFVGSAPEEPILYEEEFDFNRIKKILKISSCKTLRIYYAKDLPLVFSSIIGNIFIYPNPKQNWNNIPYKEESRIIRGVKNIRNGDRIIRNGFFTTPSFFRE